MQMNDADNEELAHLVMPETVETVVSHDMIGRLMIHVRDSHQNLVRTDVAQRLVRNSVLANQAWPTLWSNCLVSRRMNFTSSAGPS